MENPNKTVVVLDPANPDHRRLVQAMVMARNAPVAIVSPDSLSTSRVQPPQRVLSVSDLENIRRAEEKRERRALKRK
jgi:hypothetical protein